MSIEGFFIEPIPKISVYIKHAIIFDVDPKLRLPKHFYAIIALYPYPLFRFCSTSPGYRN